MRQVRVTTGSRLHFGLLRLPPSPIWMDDGTAYFGGAGLMIAEPNVEVAVGIADEWHAIDAAGARALTAAREFAKAIDCDRRFSVAVPRCPARHAGLGVGTQHALAVAGAACRLIDRTAEATELARLTGRGRRSAIGTVGFAAGGFLIDEGKRSGDEISIVRRCEFPERWELLMLMPRTGESLHGDRELSAFARLGAHSSDRMASLLSGEMEPALRAHDLSRFGAALSEYNALAGDYFRSAQHGRYSSPIVEGLVHWLRSLGAAAAGQSSWGPTVFSMWDDREHMRFVQRQADLQWGPDIEIWATTALNSGAAIEMQPDG